MKLELKHLSPYLPYKLQLGNEYSISGIMIACEDYIDDEGITTQQGYKGAHDDGTLFYSSFKTGMKPILRPLSDLTKEIDVDGEKFIPLVKLTELSSIVSPCDFNGLYIKTYDNDPDYIECYENTGSPDDHLCIAIHIPDILKCEYWMINKLFEWHFDVFGLIPEGLAININTL